MALIRGADAGLRLLEALGLNHQNVDRIVIDVQIRDVVRIYVSHLATEEQMDAAADALVEPSTRAGEPQVAHVGRLEVDEKGRVFVPAAEHARLVRALEEIRRVEVFNAEHAVAMRETARRALGG